MEELKLKDENDGEILVGIGPANDAYIVIVNSEEDTSEIFIPSVCQIDKLIVTLQKIKKELKK